MLRYCLHHEQIYFSVLTDNLFPCSGITTSSRSPSEFPFHIFSAIYLCFLSGIFYVYSFNLSSLSLLQVGGVSARTSTTFVAGCVIEAADPQQESSLKTPEYVYICCATKPHSKLEHHILSPNALLLHQYASCLVQNQTSLALPILIPSLLPPP